MKQLVSYKMDGSLNAQVLVEENKTYDQFVIDDIQENIIFQNRTLLDHYNVVMTSIEAKYQGRNKFLYGKVLQAIGTILDYKQQHKKSGVELKTAIVFLHQHIKLAPNTIQNILKLFEIEMGIGKILDISGEAFAEKQQPVWLQNVYGGAI